MKTPALALILAAALAPMALALEPAVPPVPPDAGAKIEKVATGFKFVEGPAWDGESVVYFTDIPNNRVMKFDEATGEATVAYEPSQNANGLMFDAEGRLVRCEHAGRRVARHVDGQWVTVADSFDGKKLNSPNDLDIDKAGGIYFTDPRYGNEDDRELDVYGVYYVAPDGKITQLITDLKKPNGVALSPDQKTLYVVDNGAATLWAYDVTAPGKLANGRQIADMGQGPGAGGGDGMCVDRAGHLYVTGRSDVWVFHAGGELITKIPVPEGPANCTFGGEDLRTLYITARTSLYRVKLNVPGVAR